MGLGFSDDDDEKEGDVLLLMSSLLLLEGGLAAAMSLIASRAWRTPMRPTTGPRMPPSPQLSTLSGGGGLGKTQR